MASAQVRPAEDEIYLLTDPAIHSRDGTRGGPLDHGSDGILNFFATHECTSRCKRLPKPIVEDDELRRRRERLKNKPGGRWMDKPPDDDVVDPSVRPSARHRERSKKFIFS